MAPVSNSNFQVVGVFGGEEPAFKDSEGYAMGPTKYVFHFLPRGKAFIDWIAPRSGKSGRTFGSYSVISQPNEVKVSADFVPGMDSVATEPFGTDYFDTFTIRFANRKVTAVWADDPKAPTFILSRVVAKKALRK